MKQIWAISSICLVTAFGITAADKPPGPGNQNAAIASGKPELPTVDQILEKYIQALGGRAAIQSITSRVVKATVEFPAMNAIMNAEFIAKAPNKRLKIIEVPDYGKVVDGFNGTVAWSQNPQTGISEKITAELALAKREATLIGTLN